MNSFRKKARSHNESLAMSTMWNQNSEITHSHKLTNANVKDFFFAGNATVTLRNSKSGNRFTYKIEKADKCDPKKPVFFVNVLTGSDNEKSYNFAGTLFGKFTYRHSPKSRLAANSLSVQILVAFLRFLERDAMPISVEVWHEGTCGRCGRKLTVPASILSGIGPECEKKRWKEADAQLKLTLEK